MTWLFIALIGPLLWSISNQIDKFFLSRWFAHETLGALMIFSTVIGIFVPPFGLIFPTPFAGYPPEQIALLVGAGLAALM